ncbi:hypothetical protein Lal_00048423 [Lupinus albus]|nr:hypothetical protein Lal_00048423 [Lupinus albus]
MQMDSASDEDDDRHNLIQQNERKKPRTPPSTTTTAAADTFHVEDYTSRSPRFNCKLQKSYIIAIVAIFFVLLFFLFLLADPRRTNLTSFRFDSHTDRMKESELRVIYLLRQQQLNLLTVWNHTFQSNASNSNLEDLKSAMFKQISVNREIQQVLLSAHKTGNTVEPEFDSGNPNLGQMSNHLICLEKHMFFAAVLNRVLVIPSSKVDYQYDGVIDIYHINKCVGKKVVISFEEFSNIKKDHLHIDKFLCYFSLPRPCYLDDERLKKLSSLGLSMSKPQPVWEEDIRKTKAKTVQDVLSKFTYDDDVMAIGDLFYAKVENEWVMQPGGPIAHKCKTLIEPSRLILLTAQHCLLRVIERADVPVIYLSTDAAESETGLLQSLVVLNGRPVPLVIRPARNSAEKWDALLYRHGIEEDPQVEAMLDKTISAMSSVFIGASGSTFTEDILRLRKDWGSASLCDEYLCQGEEPNVVAENE